LCSVLFRSKPYSLGSQILYFTPNSAQFAQLSQKKKQGTIYKQKLILSVPGYDGNNSFEQNEATTPYKTSILINKPLVFRLTTCQNMVIIVGRKSNPVRFKEDLQISSKNTLTKYVFERTAIERINIQQ